MLFTCVRLEKELAGVEKEYSRQPKKEELEQHIRDLVRQRDDFKIEIDKVGRFTVQFMIGFLHSLLFTA